MTRPKSARPRLRCEPLEDRTTPAVVTVTTAADVVDPNDGVTSLREAIAQADEPIVDGLGLIFPFNQIQFAQELAGATITVSQVGGTTHGAAAFEIRRGIEIQGTGQKITRAAEASPFRLFSVLGNPNDPLLNPVHLDLRNVELLGGYSETVGGAIYAAPHSKVSLYASVLADNSAAGAGGAIYADVAWVTVGNSTLTRNVARPTADGPSKGGAIFSESTVVGGYGIVEVGYSTLYDNTAGQGAQVYAALSGNYSHATVYGSILYSPQTAGDAVDDLVVTGTGRPFLLFHAADRVGTKNLIGRVSCSEWDVVSSADPMLGPLQDNGGPTRTTALLPGSPAIDAGEVPYPGGGAIDQRGFERNVGNFDIGAYEAGSGPTPPYQYPPTLPPVVYSPGLVPLPAPSPLPPAPPVVPPVVALSPLPSPALATGAAAGQPPEVRVYDANGLELKRFLAYDPSFLGGVSVAVGDVTGDGVADIVTAAGAGGGPHVKVFDGVTFAEIRSFFAYDAGFTGGVSVAVNDLDGDDRAEIVTGAGAGGTPHVCVFDGKTGAVIQSFFAYDVGFTGGVNVAVTSKESLSDNGSITTGAGPGGAPHVKVFDGTTAEERFSFLAYDAGFRGGVNVASARGTVFTGAGGGTPHVKLFTERYGRPQMTEVGSFFAGSPSGTSGVVISHGYEKSLRGLSFNPTPEHYLSIDSVIVTTIAGADGTPEVKRFRSELVYPDGETPVYTATEMPFPETDWGPVGAIGHFTAQRTLFPLA